MTNHQNSSTRRQDLEWICSKCKTQNVMDAQHCKNCGSIGSMTDRIVYASIDDD